MDINKISSFGILFISYCAISVISWDDTCRGKPIQHAEVSDTTAANVRACLDELNTKTYKELSEEKRACFYKCGLQKQGRIDANGKINKAKMIESLKAMMPEEVTAEYSVVATKCLDDFADKINSTETSCKSFNPLINCLHDSFQQICGHN